MSLVMEESDKVSPALAFLLLSAEERDDILPIARRPDAKHVNVDKLLPVSPTGDIDMIVGLDDVAVFTSNIFLTKLFQSFPHEQGLNEVSIDLSELNLKHSSTIEQGHFGESETVKWRGTWVVKTIIQRHIYHPVIMILSAKDNTLLRELRHPNILQFLGSIVQGEEMILITEYLSKGNLHDILTTKTRLDLASSVRYALDIARGMNYLHEHKPNPIVHKYLSSRNLLLDEGGHLKIGEYWVHMSYERINPNQEICQKNDTSTSAYNPLLDMKKDIYSFAHIFYEMLEGRFFLPDMNSEFTQLKSVDFEPKFKLSRSPARIQQLIKDCWDKDSYKRPTFSAVIEILDEVTIHMAKHGCPIC